MGQKVNPLAIRLGVNKTSKSRWFLSDKKSFAKTLVNDKQIRDWLKKELGAAGIGEILIDRQGNKAGVTINAARPGVIIGKKGEDVERLKKETSRIAGMPVHISIQEIKKPEMHAQLVAETIAQQLEKRVMFRRAMKRAMQTTMRLGAKGIKVAVSGRLGGAEIARTEWAKEGRIPLHTFRADIDYGFAEALTTYGIIGVKVWIYKGDLYTSEKAAHKGAKNSKDLHADTGSNIKKEVKKAKDKTN